MVEKVDSHSSVIQGLISNYTSGLTSTEDDVKFNIIPIDCMISNKTNIVANHNNLAQVKPCKSYIEIQFNKEASEVPFFQYIVLQNFYTYSISIK